MPPTETQTITVPYVAPIPVGHRIELRFFMDEKGVFKKQKVLNTYLPLLRDLESGVEYGHFEHYLKVSGLSAVPLPPHEYPLSPRTDLEWADIINGRVVACRVLTEAFSSNYQAQTTIVYEPER